MSDLIICEKNDLVAVANNIRTMTGTTGKLTIEEMATIQGGGTSEDLTAVLNTQETKLNELLEVLDGKAAGGGNSGGGGAVETCTVTMPSIQNVSGVLYMTLDDSKKPSARYVTDSAPNLTLTDVVCNSVMICFYSLSSAGGAITNGTIVNEYVGFFTAMTIDAQAGETATFTVIVYGGAGN